MIGWKPKTADARVASVRIRCLNPLRELQRRRFPVELFRPDRASGYAAVVYSKLYDEASYREASALQRRGVRIVLDLCDNHFYNPSGLPALDQVAHELRRMMALADNLIASTPAMAKVMQAELLAPRPITVIGDAIEDPIVGVSEPLIPHWWARRQLQRLLNRRKRVSSGHRRTNLVWFGVHGGPYVEHGMLDLERVRSLLEEIDREYPLSLTVVSNSREKYRRAASMWALPTAYLEWSPTTFLDALRAHQIAVIPVTRNPFTECKSNNRLVTALHAGLAVVADTIPSYQPFSDVCRLDAWEAGLREYLSDPRARERDVRAGQARVRDEWSLTRIADQWQRFFGSVCAEPLVTG
jgi:hypothetical protein